MGFAINNLKIEPNFETMCSLLELLVERYQ
jgi:hypothetical protein